MKPLVTIKRVLVLLWMCPDDKTSGTQNEISYLIFTPLIFLTNFSIVVAHSMYVLKFISIDLEGSLNATMMSIMVSGVAFILPLTIILRQNVDSILKQLSNIYDSIKNIESIRFLAHANNQSEWMCSIYFKYLKATITSVLITSTLSVYICWLINGHLIVADFYHPTPVVWPWNQATFMGYVGEIVAIITGCALYLLVGGIVLLLFISICLHHQAFHKLFEHLVYHKSKKCDKVFLCDLIRFHITVKEWFLDSAIIYSPILAIQLLCSVVAMAFSIFSLDLQLKHVTYAVLSPILTFICGILNIFIYCYFGKSANRNYEKMASCVYQMNWYELPVELQKYFILMVANMQKPLNYNGLGVAIIDLEFFAKLIQKVVSAYMLLKAITSN